MKNNICVILTVLILTSCNPFKDNYKKATLDSVCKEEIANLPLVSEEENQKLFKVMVIPNKFRKYVAAFIDDFLTGLEKKGWHILDSDTQVKSSNIVEDIQKATGIARLPDIVAFYILRKETLDKWASLPQEPFTKILVVEDLAYEYDRIPAKEFSKWGDVIFARYPQVFSRVVPDCSAKCLTFYHAATHHFGNVNRSDKKEEVFLSGNMDTSVYPLRHAAFSLSSSVGNHVNLYRHPGYQTDKDPNKEAFEYAERINKNRIAIAGAGYYPDIGEPCLIAKHFEIPATGTVMLTDEHAAPFLEPLGFIKDVNYIAASPSNLKKTIGYWLRLENREKLENIAKEGRKLITERHTNEQRVQRFDEYAVRIWKQKVRG